MIKMKIMFSMHYEAGHILSTFSLAKKLRSMGHEVVYLSIMDCKEMIESQGFDVIIFAEDIIPLGYSNKKFVSYWEKRCHDENVFYKYLDRLTNGALDSCLSAADVDLLICDPFLSYVAMRALSLGIPVVHLFTSVFLYENPDIPPITSSLYPESRVKTLLAWKLMFIKFFFVKKLKNMITREFSSPAKMHHLVDCYFQVAAKSGYPCEKNKTYRLNEIGLNLVLPEIVLCTKAFQFPGNYAHQRLYLGNFVDFERKDARMEFNFGDKPVIYCSLGTAASTYPYADDFYQAVMKASAMRKDWQFVLQISDENRINKYESTQNMLVSKWVPQLMLLKNVSVMVTHGGLNSIMECVDFEVPMVIVPGLRDQPGNAARAVYHDIAVSTVMKNIESNHLIRLIEKAMHSSGIKNGLKRMKARIEKENGLEESVKFIESFVEAKRRAVRTA